MQRCAFYGRDIFRTISLMNVDFYILTTYKALKGNGHLLLNLFMQN